MKLWSWYVAVCLPVISSSLDASVIRQYVEKSLLHPSVEESTEFFTGKVCYGVSRESGEPKIGNHPVTYDDEGNINIKILAKPNAKSTIIGVTSEVERLGLRIAAPRTDGRANMEMLKFLANVLGVKETALSIIEDNGDLKTVRVAAGNLFIEDLLLKLMDAQYKKPSHIGHPDYMNFHYVDED